MIHCIGVDCDEVLAESINEIIRLPFFDEKHITRDEITSYYLWDIEKFQLSKEKGIELFFSFFASEQYYNTQMVEGSLEKLKMFKINGYKLVVVTARDEQFKDRTIEWVERHYPGIFSDYLFMNQFSNHEKSKAELCKEYGIELLIDDNVSNIVDVNQVGIPGILLDKPWNQGSEDTELMKRVMKWEDIKID